MRRALLLGLVFLHGAFAAGMIPVLNRHLAERAPVAFALYFTAMVAGQWAIWRFGALSRARWALSAWEGQFAAALLLMAAFPTASGLMVGRFVEGIGSGATLPLIFAQVVRLPGWGTPERRIAWMNSAFAVGFVSGPFVIDGLHPAMGTRGALLVFAALFAACALAFVPAAAPAVATAPIAAEPAPRRSLDLFFPLFAAKATYGFMLALVGASAHVWFPELAIGWILLALSGVFVGGQVLGTLLVKRVPTRALLVVVPVGLAAAMIWLGAGGAPAALVGVALAHSLLALLGYRQFTSVPDDARRFALFNLLSDPGMILGATLAVAGTTGAWGLAILGLVPLLRLPFARAAAAAE